MSLLFPEYFEKAKNLSYRKIYLHIDDGTMGRVIGNTFLQNFFTFNLLDSER